VRSSVTPPDGQRYDVPVPEVIQEQDQPGQQRSPSLCSARTHTPTASPTSVDEDTDGPVSISEDDTSHATGRLPDSESRMMSRLRRLQMLTSSFPLPGMLRHGLLQPGMRSDGLLQPGMPSDGLLQPGMPSDGLLQQSNRFSSLHSRDTNVDTFTETVESLEAFYAATVLAPESNRFNQSATVLAERDREVAPSSCPLTPEQLRPPFPLNSVVRLSGLAKSTEYNGRTALLRSWEPVLARGLVQLLPPGMGAGEMRVVKLGHLEFVR